VNHNYSLLSTCCVRSDVRPYGGNDRSFRAGRVIQCMCSGDLRDFSETSDDLLKYKYCAKCIHTVVMTTL